MSDISPSVLGEGEELSPELREKLETASPEEMKKMFADELIRIGAARRDIYNPDILIPVQQPTPKRFAEAVTVNGQKVIVEGEDELAVAKKANELYRQAAGSEPQQTEQPRHPNMGRFSATPAVSDEDKAYYDMQVRTGLISAAQYLEKTNAVGEYLQRQGVSVESLKEVSDQRFTQSWASATEQFKARHPDYVGGDGNLQEFGRTLQDLNLIDNPSVESLETAFADMVRRNAYYENPELNAVQEIHQKISEAQTYQELTQALGIDERQRAAGFWR